MGDAQRETLFFVCTGTQIDFVVPFFKFFTYSSLPHVYANGGYLGKSKL